MLTFSPAIAEHEREDVTLPGDLSEAMDAGSAVLPAVKKDISTARVRARSLPQSKPVSASTFLATSWEHSRAASWTSAQAFAAPHSLTFEFGDVSVSTVRIIALAKFPNVARINATAKEIKKWMQAGKVAVISAVARSKKYIVTAQNGKGADISADVPGTKGVASRNLKVSATAPKDRRWCSKVQSRSPSGYRQRH